MQVSLQVGRLDLRVWGGSICSGFLLRGTILSQIIKRVVQWKGQDILVNLPRN